MTLAFVLTGAFLLLKFEDYIAVQTVSRLEVCINTSVKSDLKNESYEISVLKIWKEITKELLQGKQRSVFADYHSKGLPCL